MKFCRSLLAWLLIASTVFGAGAVTSTTIWRVRPGGNDANGAGFDASTASAGTDYSQQDSPQISHTDWSCLVADDAGRLVISTASTDCTAAMIGNYVRISAGTGWVTGYYQITSCPSSSKLGLASSPANGADRTSGTGKVGGAAATIQRIGATGNSTGDKIVAGNIVYVRGAGSDAPATADYTYTTFFQPVTGTASAPVKFIGENGRPRFDGSSYDVLFFNVNNLWVENFYIKSGAANAGYTHYFGANNTLKNCVIHTNDLNIDGVNVAAASVNCRIIDCELLSKTTAPTTRTGKALIQVGSGVYNLSVSGCTIYRAAGSGIRFGGTAGGVVKSNLIVLPKEYCVNMLTGGSYNLDIVNNTMDQAGIDALKIADATTLFTTRIYSNLFTNAAAYGVDVAGGTAASNAIGQLEGYNAFHGNATANSLNLTLDSSDQALGATPYTQSSTPTTDWSVGTGVKALGFPHTFRSVASGVATIGYTDVGAVERQEPAAASSPPLSGGLIIGQ